VGWKMGRAGGHDGNSLCVFDKNHAHCLQSATVISAVSQSFSFVAVCQSSLCTKCLLLTVETQDILAAPIHALCMWE
jgi:hypothetical protein